MFPFTTLLPVFARDLVGVGAKGQGLLLAAMGFGALVSAATIAPAGHRLVRGRVMIDSSISMPAESRAERFEQIYFRSTPSSPSGPPPVPSMRS
jgi:hypothetical protein